MWCQTFILGAITSHTITILLRCSPNFLLFPCARESPKFGVFEPNLHTGFLCTGAPIDKILLALHKLHFREQPLYNTFVSKGLVNATPFLSLVLYSSCQLCPACHCDVWRVILIQTYVICWMKSLEPSHQNATRCWCGFRLLAINACIIQRITTRLCITWQVFRESQAFLRSRGKPEPITDRGKYSTSCYCDFLTFCKY